MTTPDIYKNTIFENTHIIFKLIINIYKKCIS